MFEEPITDLLDNFHFKTLIKHDIPFLLAFEMQAFPVDHWTEESFKRVLERDPQSITLLEDNNGKIIGYVHSDIRKKKRANGNIESVGEIGSIAVDQAYQGRGLGSILFEGAIKRLRSIGAPKIILQTRVENSKLQKLATHSGFRISGIIPNMYGQGQDAYEMELK